jgi:hypothetical protein
MPPDLTFKNFVFACIFCVFIIILKANIHIFLKNIDMLCFVMEILVVLWQIEINF